MRELLRSMIPRWACFNPAIELIHIHTVPQVPWQQQNIWLPKATQETATAIVKVKLRHDIFEYFPGALQITVFSIEKNQKDPNLLFNDVKPLNRYAAGYGIRGQDSIYDGTRIIEEYMATSEMTNSVSVFMRVICKVHWRQIPHQVRPVVELKGQRIGTAMKRSRSK